MANEGSQRAREAYHTWGGLLGLGLVGTTAVLVPPLDTFLEAHQALHHLQHAIAFVLSMVAGRASHGLFVTGSVHGSGGWQRWARTLLVTNRHFNPGGIPGLLFAAGLTALWHVPALFNLAVVDPNVHVLEHVSFVLAGGAVGVSLPHMGLWTRLGALLLAVLLMLFLSVLILMFGLHVYVVYPREQEVLFAIAMVYTMMPLMLYTVYRFLVAQVS